MTARIRPSLVLALAALAAVVVACDVLPSPSASPTSRTDPWTTGPFGPEVVSTAIGALDGLASYRFVGTTAEGDTGASEARGTVVNGEVRRTRIAYSAGGSLAGATITIASRTWVRVSGSTYQEQDDSGVDDNDWVNPVARLLDPWSLGITVVENLGPETHSGVDTRHLRSSVTAGDVVDDDGLPVGNGFSGTVDAWIAVDGGHLVAASVVGTEAPPGGDATGPAPSPVAYRLDIVVEGVNDPANVIEAPVTGGPTPAPVDDPVAIQLIRGIADGQGALDSYVYSITSSIAGFDITSRLTVVNRPTAAAQVETDGVSGFEGTTVLAVGDLTWSRTGSGAWQPGRPGDEPACGIGADATSDPAPCTLARLVDIGSSLRTMRSTFAVVSTDERTVGIDVTHLRSEGGVRQGEDVIPGTRDVWIATDGGYLVRDVFTGPEISFEAVIGRVNDPLNRLAAPTR